jgi:farnesyl-diphosphate farnesyltransferase
MDDFIARHLLGVSRTYALVVPMLPPALADPVGLAYLVMRVVDTLEDDTHLTASDRRTLLAALDRALDGDPTGTAQLVTVAGDTPEERALMQAAGQLFDRLQRVPASQAAAIRTCARAMAAGVQELLDRSAARRQAYPAVRDAAELREYCYYVAGVVGEMLCTLMADYLGDARLLEQRATAVELGTGLQLVNILKDAHGDSHHGRRYLPTVPPSPPSHLPASPPSDSACGADSGVPGGVSLLSSSAASRAIFDAALRAARAALHRGVDYVLALPAHEPGLRRFCGLPIAWGGLTLARAAHEKVGAKVDRATIHETIARFDTLVHDDAALRAWLVSLIESTRSGSPDSSSAQ